jgi:hypothetical protein
VHVLPIQDLAQACRIFMELAYPEGADTIPANKRPYADLPIDASAADYLPPAPCAVAVCQDLSKLKGGLRGYEFRLGSSAHPHLKLRVQPMDFHDRDVWVFSVDTHDRFLLATPHLDPDEAQKFHDLMESNRQLKHQIEDALALAGFLTPKGMLQIDLTSAS